jgi:hypothetical protein
LLFGGSSHFWDTTPHSRQLGFPFFAYGRTGRDICEHFLVYQIIKTVPKERGTRSNAGLGASGHIVFFTRIFVWFRLSCGYNLLRFVMIVYTHDLSADRWLDVSFVLDVFAGGINHDGLEMGGIYTGLGSACRFSVEHACVLTTDDGFSMVHRR